MMNQKSGQNVLSSWCQSPVTLICEETVFLYLNGIIPAYFLTLLLSKVKKDRVSLHIVSHAIFCGKICIIKVKTIQTVLGFWYWSQGITEKWIHTFLMLYSITRKITHPKDTRFCKRCMLPDLSVSITNSFQTRYKASSRLTSNS